MKRCFKCKNDKSLDEFYTHSEMSDGHLNKCKECTRRDNRITYHRPEKRNHLIAYERRRAADPERKAKQAVYLRTSRQRNRAKFAARNKVSNALRDGKLAKLPCEVCQSAKTQAHHTDYMKPLD